MSRLLLYCILSIQVRAGGGEGWRSTDAMFRGHEGLLMYGEGGLDDLRGWGRGG